MLQKKAGVWDVFCTVVDNFGDIGVTWRLARQLAAEHGLCVRLWVDDLGVFSKICPEVSVELSVQPIQGVEVCLWPRPWQAPVEELNASVVIEAFACTLPEPYLLAMQQRAAQQSVLWLNLDYLTAESWALSCHGLPSMQASGLKKFFFFPGFMAESGGLLRERTLLEQRNYLQKSPALRAAFLESLGIFCDDSTLLISLFAYENWAVDGLLAALSCSPKPVRLLIPESKVLRSVEQALGRSLKVGALYQKGNLQVQVLPFMDMDGYDRLLWCCDLNMVRGEDSFVRAQWAARPLVWHIYPQEEEAHWYKLEAFFQCYSEGLAPEDAALLWTFWSAWNKGGFAQPDTVLKLLERLPVFKLHAEHWSQRQAAQKDLAGKLVSFYSDWL